MENLTNQVKKGTTTVGLVCKDGLVLAADMRATAGGLIVTKTTDKVIKINDDIVVTLAGTVSDAQLLVKLIRAELKLRQVRLGRRSTVKEAANMLGNMVYENIRRMSMIPGIAHFLLGGRDDTGFYVYDIYPDGSVTLIEDYISSGSGSVMAFGVLETLYNKEIDTTAGVKLATQSINAALQRDTATGNGINVFTVTDKGVERVKREELSMKLTE